MTKVVILFLFFFVIVFIILILIILYSHVEPSSVSPTLLDCEEKKLDRIEYILYARERCNRKQSEDSLTASSQGRFQITELENELRRLLLSAGPRWTNHRAGIAAARSVIGHGGSGGGGERES